jgi:hypothetical protein
VIPLGGGGVVMTLREEKGDFVGDYLEMLLGNCGVTISKYMVTLNWDS